MTLDELTKEEKKQAKKDRKNKRHKQAETRSAMMDASTENSSSKRRKLNTASNDSSTKVDTPLPLLPSSSSDNKPVSDRKRKRAAKRVAQQIILDKLPKVDRDGMPYTKLQLRRMRKRVEKGLDPIETDAERTQRLQREAEMQREEQAELAGDRVNEKPTPVAAPDGEEAEQKNAHDNKEESSSGHNDGVTPATARTPSKRRHRAKPVPADYVCAACQAVATHWIYDCAAKQTVRGRGRHTSQPAQDWHHALDARKLFVSGLPFDVRRRDIDDMFGAANVVHVKLHKFADNSRCNGQGIVLFATEAAARAALALNGSMMANPAYAENKKMRAELRLQVSKVHGRYGTKNRAESGAPSQSNGHE